ncbi:restriction endonuclease subunit S [Pseudomonas protegens]|uniref:restriction endonuclease subunit S n=1 Tax=Pseudomonas protegens TaxID=380021 RepID=UPI001474E25C|nr:restriction endonuclease subunit S [Pseudomonas protegens]NMZ30132.1 restriction endonuclease subunit S [Pseudomonas protegens]NMZ84999.1 restriction endonuclease subunit S [Pseudomonas protegens]
MSFSAYPAYKESGVKWLPKVPEHWDIRRNKQTFRIVSTLVGSKSKDFQLLSLTLRGVIPRDIESGKGKFPAEFDTYQTVEPDNVIFCLFDIDETPRTVGISSDYGMITGAYTVVRAFAVADPRFIYYYYFSIDLRKGLRPFYTGLRKVVRPETFMNIELPLPPRHEQANICNFLDHETARIDALIEEQQRLIELLKEKRQAVISHAVTKGLDPTVPMKDSGVEWLGEVPAHWVVGPLRWYATIQGGIAKGKDYEGRETVSLPYLRVANVQNGFVDLTEVKEISVLESEIGRYSLRSGDVLMNEGGDNDKLGRGTVWQGQIEPCLHQNHVFAIRPNDLLSAEWLTAFTQCDQARSYFFLNSKQSTNLASISASNVMSLALPIPSVIEQKEILSSLNQSRVAHEELVNLATSTIEFLKERRSALISAAVTGKIDVRGWQPPTTATSPELAQEAV